MTRFLLLLVGGLLALGSLLPIPAEEPEPVAWRAGIGKCDITPPVGFPMWGYGARKDAPSVGVRDRLEARALILEGAGKRVALVGLDLGRAPTRDSTARIETALKENRIDALFLVGSHTHHGPLLELDDWPTKEKPYTRDLEAKLIQVVRDAVQDLKPARWAVASTHGPWNRNRHSKLPDKPVDDELQVLRVETLDGKTIAHAVNFAAHPTILPAKLLEFSADYPGAMRRAVEKETGAPCLFLQGAAGDLSPVQKKSGDPDDFGQMLAAEVLKLGASLKVETSRQPTLRVAHEEFRFKPRVDLSNPLVSMAYSQAFFPALVAAYEREYRDGIRPRLDVALLDGKFGLVGVSGEPFCAHSLSLKRRARLERIFVMGYCNDYHQYFPTIEAAAEGGYGADFAVAIAEVGAGERMFDAALLHLYRMRGKFVP
jgi:hypothetical protein